MTPAGRALAGLLLGVDGGPLEAIGGDRMMTPDDYRRCRVCRLTAVECDCATVYDDEAAAEDADRQFEEQQEVRAINDRLGR